MEIPSDFQFQIQISIGRCPLNLIVQWAFEKSLGPTSLNFKDIQTYWFKYISPSEFRVQSVSPVNTSPEILLNAKCCMYEDVLKILTRTSANKQTMFNVFKNNGNLYYYRTVWFESCNTVLDLFSISMELIQDEV